MDGANGARNFFTWSKHWIAALHCSCCASWLTRRGHWGLRSDWRWVSDEGGRNVSDSFSISKKPLLQAKCYLHRFFQYLSFTTLKLTCQPIQTSTQIYLPVWNLVIAMMALKPLIGTRKGRLRRHHHDPLLAVAWCESLGKKSLQAGCLCLHILTLIFVWRKHASFAGIIALSCKVMKALGFAQAHACQCAAWVCMSMCGSVLISKFQHRDGM